MTRGSGSKNEDKERTIRKWFVDQDYIDGVILLPENLFYNVGAAGVIVVLSKRKPAARRGKMTLVNASGRFTKGRPKNHISETDRLALADMFLAGVPVEGEVAVVETADIAEADYNLSPGRWVRRADDREHRTIGELLLELDELHRQDIEVTQQLLTSLRPLEEVQA